MDSPDPVAPAVDTIVAIATAAGAAGIGVVRLSGPAALDIAAAISGGALQPRRAHYRRFQERDGTVLDDGIALAFPAPASYTGEDVAELQAHGSPAVLRRLVALCVEHGARQARPGEFSERAFLNGRLDLAQAEAVADLIAAGDLRAARAARRALDGGFSTRVEAIAARVLSLRVHVEAMIDFSDEPIETLGAGEVAAGLEEAAAGLDALLAAAERGRKLRDGLHAVIVGPPNAGKSSLLNALAGSERAIVTDIAGTTRDLLRETVRVDGVELDLVDTAGLREGGDAIEREGMRRARAELERADLAIVVLDGRDPEAGRAAVAEAIAGVPQVLWLYNKADLVPAPHPGDAEAVWISARTGQGLEQVHQRLHALAGGGHAGADEFTARARHVEALERAAGALQQSRAQLDAGVLELAAEALRQAHDALGEITGRVSPDELLGRIFSTFCIGK